MYYIARTINRTTNFLANKKKIKRQPWVDNIELAQEFKFRSEADFAAGDLRCNNIEVIDQDQASAIQDNIGYAGMDFNQFDRE